MHGFPIRRTNKSNSKLLSRIKQLLRRSFFDNELCIEYNRSEEEVMTMKGQFKKG